MNNHVHARIWQHSRASGVDLLVLLAISENGSSAVQRGPLRSVEHYADRCRVSTDAIRQSVERLVELGEMAVNEDRTWFILPMPIPRSWSGAWPLNEAEDDYPAEGVPVVYFLYDTEEKLAYIGSTKEFIARMDQHARDKTWVRWKAHSCRNRKAAYVRESFMIARCRPYLNRRIPFDQIEHVGRRPGGRAASRGERW